MLFPSPIAFYIFSHPVRWYGIAYAVGSILAWQWSVFLVKKKVFSIPEHILADFLAWVMPSIIVFGRLGHILLYETSYYLERPLQIFCVWKGGMSVHGAILGCALTSWWFCKRNGISWLTFSDCCLCGVPIGIFLGRVANFLNQELYGKPWSKGIIFPYVDNIARHPSQLYEALLEGVILFGVINYFSLKSRLSHRPGGLSGCFLIGYGLARWVCEYAREPDSAPWFNLKYFSPGQVYSIPMLILGVYLLITSCFKTRN